MNTTAPTPPDPDPRPADPVEFAAWFERRLKARLPEGAFDAQAARAASARASRFQPMPTITLPVVRKQQKPPVLPPLPPPAPVEAVKGQRKYETDPQSKKVDLSKLPANWRQRVFEATESRRKNPSGLRQSVAIIWATGCRPAELEEGVEIKINEAGLLVFHIRGAKYRAEDEGPHKAKRGLEWREIVVAPGSTPAADLLINLVQRAPGKKMTFDYKSDSLRAQLYKIGQEVFQKMKDPPVISAYTFRHAMGADLKSCDDMTDIERSQVMGHLSQASLLKYGRRRRGGGGVRPVQAVTASAVPHGERSRESAAWTDNAAPVERQRG
jgi:integrase